MATGFTLGFAGGAVVGLAAGVSVAGASVAAGAELAEALGVPTAPAPLAVPPF
ncbi:hypothetical protein [Streptomyces sp. NPDC004788]